MLQRKAALRQRFLLQAVQLDVRIRELFKVTLDNGQHYAVFELPSPLRTALEALVVSLADEELQKEWVGLYGSLACVWSLFLLYAGSADRLRSCGTRASISAVKWIPSDSK